MIAIAYPAPSDPLESLASDPVDKQPVGYQADLDVPVVEVDLHLNTPEFGKEAVELFHKLYTQKQ